MATSCHQKGVPKIDSGAYEPDVCDTVNGPN